MIHYLKNTDEWITIENLSTVKQVIDHFNLADAVEKDKLAQRLGFGLDVWVFLDPQRRERILFHFDSKEDAEAEYNWLLTQ